MREDRLRFEPITTRFPQGWNRKVLERVRRQSFAICALLTSLPTFVKRPFGNGFTVSAGKVRSLVRSKTLVTKPWLPSWFPRRRWYPDPAGTAAAPVLVRIASPARPQRKYRTLCRVLPHLPTSVSHQINRKAIEKYFRLPPPSQSSTSQPKPGAKQAVSLV